MYRYDWIILQIIVVSGYVGWMLYSSLFIIEHYVSLKPSKPTSSKAPLLGLTVFSAISAKFLQERAPWTYYLYAAFPCFFWSRVLASRAYLKHFAVSKSNALALFVLVAALELCVVGYFKRTAWSIGLILLGVAWPTLDFSDQFRQHNKGVGAAWTVSCLATAVFPILPVEKGESLPLL